MNCFNCNSDFEITKSGAGGKNRKYCYDCFPEGLSKVERADLRMELLRKKSDAQKVEIGCCVCGYNRTARALEWHHPSEDKEASPSNLLKSSWEKYENEIRKCILLCSNCHREVHDGIIEV